MERFQFCQVALTCVNAMVSPDVLRNSWIKIEDHDDDHDNDSHDDHDEPIYRIVLLDGERLERKAQSYLVRKPQTESARCPFTNFDGRTCKKMVMMMIISLTW